jgi:hypothetical protein
VPLKPLADYLEGLPNRVYGPDTANAKQIEEGKHNIDQIIILINEMHIHQHTLWRAEPDGICYKIHGKLMSTFSNRIQK